MFKLPPSLNFYVLTITAMILSCFIASAPAAAIEVDGVSVPESVKVGVDTLVLNGSGIRKATFLRFHVYVGALYLREKSSDPQVILNSIDTKLITLHFVRAVAKEDLRKAWLNGFRDNNPNHEDVAAKLEQLTAGLGDTEVGTVLSYTFTNHGVTLESSAGIKNTVEDPTFATDVLRIWLGESPADKGLKAALLGQDT